MGAGADLKLSGTEIKTVLKALGQDFLILETTKPSHRCEGFVLYGAGTRSRTRDLLITSQLLYQLSYTGVLGRRL